MRRIVACILVLTVVFALAGCARARKETIPVTVKREGNRVWLEGAKEVFEQHFKDSKEGRTTPWAERSDSYMYLVQMRIAGWDVDYPTLITVAGYGPSFTYAPRPNGAWGAHYFPPKGRDQRIAHATGCQYRWRKMETPEAYWEGIKKAIDEGQAVHGPNEEDVLFIGYVDAEKVEDRKVMPLAIVFVEDDEWDWEQFKKWHARRMVNGWFGRIEGRVEPLDPRESAVEVIKVMVEAGKGNDSRRKPGDGVTWGVEGIEAYAVDLADVSKQHEKEDGSGFFQGGWCACHNVYPQISGRPAAAAWLKRVAPLFDGATRDHLLEAATNYDKATESWREFLANLGGKRAGQMEPEDPWADPACRKTGSEAVAEAARHERAAIRALEQALASME